MPRRLTAPTIVRVPPLAALRVPRNRQVAARQGNIARSDGDRAAVAEDKAGVDVERIAVAGAQAQGLTGGDGDGAGQDDRAVGNGGGPALPAPARIVSLVPLKVTALPANILKVVAAVEVAARTSVALFRVIAAPPSGPVAGPARVALSDRHQAAAVHLELVPPVNEPLVPLSVKKPPPVLVMVSAVPPSLTRPASLRSVPAATLNVGDPLRAVLPVKLSSPPPVTLNVLPRERLPKLTVPSLLFNKDGAVTLTALA